MTKTPEEIAELSQEVIGFLRDKFSQETTASKLLPTLIHGATEHHKHLITNLPPSLVEIEEIAEISEDIIDHLRCTFIQETESLALVFHLSRGATRHHDYLVTRLFSDPIEAGPFLFNNVED